MKIKINKKNIASFFGGGSKLLFSDYNLSTKNFFSETIIFDDNATEISEAGCYYHKSKESSYIKLKAQEKRLF